MTHFRSLILNLASLDSHQRGMEGKNNDETIPSLNVRDDLKDLAPEEIKIIARRNLDPAAVLCLNLKGDNNLGMIMRTAANFSMSKMYIVGRRFYDRRTAVGMQNYIDVERLTASKGDNSEFLDEDAIMTLLEKLEKTYTIVFVEQGGVNLRCMGDELKRSTKPPLFVMGAEDHGIPKSILEFKPSVKIEIPQTGVGRSFNVNTAFSMVAWEYFRDKV